MFISVLKSLFVTLEALERCEMSRYEFPSSYIPIPFQVTSFNGTTTLQQFQPFGLNSVCGVVTLDLRRQLTSYCALLDAPNSGRRSEFSYPVCNLNMLCSVILKKETKYILYLTDEIRDSERPIISFRRVNLYFDKVNTVLRLMFARAQQSKKPSKESNFVK